MYSRHPDLKRFTERMNNKALWIGLGSCLGISIVGNFQETNVRIAHYVGAISCFGCGTVYFWMQAVISYYLQPYLGTMARAHIRLGLSVLCTVLFFVIAVTGLISHILFNGQDPRKWYPSDGGWEYHIASSISEWLMSTAFCFYILTFSEEFRSISVEHPQLVFLDFEDDEILNETVNEENTLVSQDSEVISWSQLNDRFITSHHSKIKPKRKIIRKSKSLSYIYDCKDYKIDFIKEKKNIVSNPLNSEQVETSTNKKSLIVADSRKLADLTLSLMLAAFFEILHCFSMFLNDNLRKYSFEKNFNVWQLLYILFLFIS